MSKQCSTLLSKKATMSNEFILKFLSFWQSRMLLRHCCRFWQHVQFASTLSNGRNFVRHCCQKRKQCRSNVWLCRINTGLCQKNRSTCSIRQSLLPVWTGLNTRSSILLAALFSLNSDDGFFRYSKPTWLYVTWFLMKVLSQRTLML